MHPCAMSPIKASLSYSRVAISFYSLLLKTVMYAHLYISVQLLQSSLRKPTII